MEEDYIPKLIQPVRTQIRIGDKMMTVFNVEVSGEDYQTCQTIAGRMGSNSWKGTWGKGLINTETDRTKAERTGRIGEMAWCKIFGTPVDCSFRQHGDKMDFVLTDSKTQKLVTVDVKTANNGRPWYSAGLVQATNDYGTPKALKCDMYLFGYVERQMEVDKVMVVLVGGSRKGFVERQEVVASRSKKGQHYNYEIPYSEMISMDELFLQYGPKV